ncbi:MAG: LptF/LptG family permease, partial [Deltaproteobacteria bacterium]|nr:LptF/LptG family permease [Deltaproteobacteria bacterium]
MKVLDRHLATLFAKNLALCMAGFLTLYMVVDFVEKISDFLHHEVSFDKVAIYFLAQIPNVSVLLIP